MIRWNKSEREILFEIRRRDYFLLVANFLFPFPGQEAVFERNRVEDWDFLRVYEKFRAFRYNDFRGWLIYGCTRSYSDTPAAIYNFIYLE